MDQLLALWAHSTSSFRWSSLRSSPSVIQCTPGVGFRTHPVPYYRHQHEGQQSAGPAGDGQIQVVSGRCLTSLSGHLLRPVGIGPPYFSFIRYNVPTGAVSIVKDKYLTPAHSLKTIRASHSAQFFFFFFFFDSLRPLNNLSVMRDGLPGLNQY